MLDLWNFSVLFLCLLGDITFFMLYIIWLTLLLHHFKNLNLLSLFFSKFLQDIKTLKSLVVYPFLILPLKIVLSLIQEVESLFFLDSNLAVQVYILLDLLTHNIHISRNATFLEDHFSFKNMFLFSLLSLSHLFLIIISLI